jgi:hypothetical protein
MLDVTNEFTPEDYERLCLLQRNHLALYLLGKMHRDQPPDALTEAFAAYLRHIATWFFRDN